MSCVDCLQVVSEDRIAMIEQCGKFTYMKKPGLLWLPIPCICVRKGDITTRVMQTEFEVETITADKVFVTISVAVQYKVIPEKAFDAFYRLTRRDEQINAYVFDSVRSTVPKLTVDMCFEQKDETADEVQNDLGKHMDEFGYQITQVLITDIVPDVQVRDAMNEISKSKRERDAMVEKAEAEKILTVNAAEGERNAKKLAGEGVARQRKAIVDGLRDSVGNFAEASGQAMTSKDILELVLCTQYFDTIREMAHTKKNKCVFLHNSNSDAPYGQKALM